MNPQMYLDKILSFTPTPQERLRNVLQIYENLMKEWKSVTSVILSYKFYV